MMAWVANPNQWIGVQLPNLAYELSRQVKLVLKQMGICSWGNILSSCVVSNYFLGHLGDVQRQHQIVTSRFL
jgi:hypothetical protein